MVYGVMLTNLALIENKMEKAPIICSNLTRMRIEVAWRRVPPINCSTPLHLTTSSMEQ